MSLEPIPRSITFGSIDSGTQSRSTVGRSAGHESLSSAGARTHIADCE
jgi:hypothetical protein